MKSRWRQILAVTGTACFLACAAMAKDEGTLEAFDGSPVSLEALIAAADAGEPIAQLNLGRAYASGSGLEQDPVTAYAWFSIAAAQGNDAARIERNRLAQTLPIRLVDEAERMVSNWYVEGRAYVNERDAPEIYYDSEKLDNFATLEEVFLAAENGDVAAQYTLAGAYANGDHGAKVDHSEAFKWTQRTAERGIPESQYMTGTAYLEGRGVDQDEAKAFEWLYKAAEQGLPAAQILLAQCFERGIGTNVNMTDALAWYKRASKAGQKDAQFYLGGLYLAGDKTERDFDAATRLITMAAEQQVPDAQTLMGFMYRGGIGVEKNYVVAESWFRRAAIQGHAKAQRELGDFYLGAPGIEPDIDEAVTWLRAASDQGDPDAQTALASVLLYLDPVLDYSKAYQWAIIAETRGYEPARKFRKAAAKKLSKEERVAAKQMAQAWLNEHPATDEIVTHAR